MAQQTPQIRDIYAEFAEDELRRKYEIGKRLNTGEANPKRYGEHFVPEVAKSLDVSESTLYRWRDVAKQYPWKSYAPPYLILSPTRQLL